MLHSRYAASLLIRTHPPPSRLRPISRFSRLYGLPCSDDFAPGRGGFLQLLGMSLSPCCRFYPAEVNSRISQSSAAHIAFAIPLVARPSVIFTFEATMRSLLLRPGELVNLPEGDLVDRLQSFCFHHLCYPHYGALTFTPAGLTPAEHASLRWTHNGTCSFPAFRFHEWLREIRREGISETRLTSLNSLRRRLVG